jgi:pimeloyl-ACP methyl ester carboxylesterase
VGVSLLHALEQAGSAPAVVCLHGWCQSSAYWAPTLERLAAAGVHGLAPDLPGFGASAGLPGPYTMEGLADALARLLDERRLAQVVLVGGSMGGVVAQHLMLRHPGRARRLLLVATGAATADPVAALARADALADAAWDKALIAQAVRAFFHYPPPAAELDRYCEIALMASQAAAVEAARSNARSRTMERLDAIEIPTLIVQGRHDQVRTPEHGKLMQERIKGARLEIIERAGHTPQLEDPAAFHGIALPFLTADRS